jgi:hypothetical protein
MYRSRGLSPVQVKNIFSKKTLLQMQRCLFASLLVPIGSVEYLSAVYLRIDAAQA